MMEGGSPEVPGTRKRKFHPKSRRGCLQCKVRRVKCDEGLPACSACMKRDQKCEREPAPAAVSRSATFRRFVNVKTPPPTSPPAPKVTNGPAHAALEYFYLRTLPVLRICQPSMLWDAMANTLPQRDESIRNIAIALGFAQRLETEPELNKPDSPFARQAMTSYTDALRSLRTCMAPGSTKDYSLHAFASLLLVVLESMWRAPSAMLMHLRSGLQITKAAEASLSSFKTVNREIARLLERYRVSSSLYGLLAVPSTDLSELDASRPTCENHGLPTAEDENLASQQYEVIGGSIQVWRGISGASTLDEQEEAIEEQLSRLQIQHANIQDRLIESNPPSGGSHLQQFSQAQMQLTALALRSASVSNQESPERENESFGAILDTLDDALAKVRSLQAWHGHDPGPFSIGLGVISALGLIALTCHNARIRQRAIDLLDHCPRREGLWDAAEIRQMCTKANVSESSHRRNFHQLALQRMHSVLKV